MLRSEWESLFAGIDEENLPPLSSQHLGFGEILFLKTNMAMDHPSFEGVGPIVKIGIFHCHLLFLGMYLMYQYY